MSEHLGYEKHAFEGRDGGNSRNGTRSKTVLTDIGPIDVDVPRDRDGTFEPLTVRKRQRRLEGVDAMVISLCAKGLTTGEIAAHLKRCMARTSRSETISKITDAVLEEMTGWLARPLDRVYPVVFIDAIHVKVRDGQVANRAVLHGDRRHRGRPTRHLGDLAQLGRRGRQVLAGCPHRDPQPRRRRRVHRGLRRTQGPARRDRRDVAARDHPDLCAAPDPQHVPPRRPSRLGQDGPRLAARVHRASTKPPPRNASSSSAPHGATATRRSDRCGRTPGPSSCRSWTTAPRSAASSTRRTRSRASTHGSDEPPAHAATSPTSRPL